MTTDPSPQPGVTTDLAGWRVPEPRDMDTFEAGFIRRKRQGGIWQNDGQLSPLAIYCLLKNRFGPPNGPMMMARHPSTDNFIQWDYLLASDAGDMLNVMQTTNALEMFWYAGRAVTDADWTALITSFTRAVKSDKAKIAAEQTKLEEWALFINPFRRLEFIIWFLRDALDKTPSDPVKIAAAGFPKEGQLEEWKAAMNEATRKYRHSQMYALSLRVLIPIWVESFVNLLVFLLARKELKDDQRLMDSVIRQPIDVRAKTLGINCLHFAKGIDGNAPEFKAFHTLMNGRNDLVHGNIEPKRLVFETVFFDGMIPLFEKDGSFMDRMLAAENKFIEADTARSDLEVARSFIGYVLSCLTDAARVEVQGFMRNGHPGWNKQTNRPGILFSDRLVAAMMVPKEPTDKSAGAPLVGGQDQSGKPAPTPKPNP